MAGLSMEDLAGKLGGLVTKQAISKYEQGQMLPSREVLEKLVEALKIATCGASPLRDSEKELEEARSMQSPAWIDIEAMERPMFRRTSILNRLRRKDNGERSASIAGESKKGPSAALFILSQASPSKLAEDAGPDRLRDVQNASMVEGFSPLAARRAHLVRDWGTGAGLDKIRFRAGERLSAKTG